MELWHEYSEMNPYLFKNFDLDSIPGRSTIFANFKSIFLLLIGRPLFPHTSVWVYIALNEYKLLNNFDFQVNHL